MKRFKKFKSDFLWEKENAHYESLDSDDSLDMSTKVNKTEFHRSQNMDRMDLTESNVKKKEKIKKELGKAYLTVHSTSSGNHDYSGQKNSREVKINIFDQSGIRKVGDSLFRKPKKSLAKDSRKRFAEDKREEMGDPETRSVHETSIVNRQDFLPKVMNDKLRISRRSSHSLNRNSRSINKSKNLKTQKNMMDMKKRFETEDDVEDFKFY